VVSAIYQPMRSIPPMKSKWRSRLKREKECRRQSAPIQTSLAGIGSSGSFQFGSKSRVEDGRLFIPIEYSVIVNRLGQPLLIVLAACDC